MISDFRRRHPFLYDWSRTFLSAASTILVLKLIGVPLP
jgi:hypothetical protein